MAQVIRRGVFVLLAGLSVACVSTGQPGGQPEQEADQEKTLLDVIPAERHADCGLSQLSEEQVVALTAEVAEILKIAVADCYKSHKVDRDARTYLESEGWYTANVIGTKRIKTDEWSEPIQAIVISGRFGLETLYGDRFGGEPWQAVGALRRGQHLARGYGFSLEVLDSMGRIHELSEVDEWEDW